MQELSARRHLIDGQPIKLQVPALLIQGMTSLMDGTRQAFCQIIRLEACRHADICWMGACLQRTHILNSLFSTYHCQVNFTQGEHVKPVEQPSSPMSRFTSCLSRDALLECGTQGAQRFGIVQDLAMLESSGSCSMSQPSSLTTTRPSIHSC